MPHAASLVQPRQVRVPGSQTGVAFGQSVLVRQPTQMPIAVSHSAVVPPHAPLLLTEHCPQRPDDWQAGVAPPQSPSPAHARHACVARLQIGVMPEHCALATQATHRPADTSHVGVVPEQRLALPAEHWPQAPEAWHAGVAPPHSPSMAQARQTRAPASHTGVAPLQSAFERQPAQVPVPT